MEKLKVNVTLHITTSLVQRTWDGVHEQEEQ